MINFINILKSFSPLHGHLKDIHVNPYTLRFNNNNLEKEFCDYYYTRLISQFRFVVLVGIIIFTFTHFTDYLVLREKTFLLRYIRFYVLIPLEILILIFSFSKYAAKYFQLLAALAILIAGFGVIAMIIIGKGSTIPDLYFIGIILAMFILFLLIGLRFYNAFISGFVLITVFIISSFAFRISSFEHIVSYHILTVASGMVAMIGAYLIEFYMRQNFYNNKRLLELKESLEEQVHIRTKELEKSNKLLKKKSRIQKETLKRQKKLQNQLVKTQKMEAIGLLAGGVAHDFNNLLTVINGFSEMLLQKHKSDEDSRTALNQILIAGKKAEKLTKQLLAFGRRQIMQPVEFDINLLIKDIEYIITHLGGDKVKFSFDFENDDLFIHADPVQIEQVIINLVINAREAMPNGGIIKFCTKSIELAELKKTFSSNDDTPQKMVKLSISDTGSGMDKKIIKHAFEPFFTTKEKGTGLGLATVYGIIRQSGGQIEIKSSPGKGTTFNIYFKRCFIKQKPLKKFKKNISPNTKPQKNDILILIVDDEEAVLELVISFLKSAGYKVLSASNGNDALDIYIRHKNEIDLIISDIVMPKIDGFELINEIHEINPKQKYILMSGFTENSFATYKNLDNNFIQKPFDRDTIIFKINEIIKQE